jgi:Fe-S-cluster-containing hydrogenase component 2
MLTPGVEIPHLCAQCTDYPCIESCPDDALSIDEMTSAVRVDKEKCTSCGLCIKACPGKIPHIHPRDGYVIICDLCFGNPRCVKACTDANFDALSIVKEKPNVSHNLFARLPEDITRDVAVNLYGEEAEEVV